jgi:hypothetical protein
MSAFWGPALFMGLEFKRLRTRLLCETNHQALLAAIGTCRSRLQAGS